MKRSISLDSLKIILSILVIIAHIQPLFEKDSFMGWVLANGFGRIAVPCFFIINGFFFANKIGDNKAVKKYLLHILLIYAVWSVLYGTTYFSWAGWQTIVGRILMGYHHLWYLPALMLGILLLVLSKKYFKKDIYIAATVAILFTIGHILDPSREMAQMYRNGLFYGFPYIAIGYFLKKYELTNKFGTSQLAIIAIVGASLVVLETYLLFIKNTGTELQLGGLFLCPALVLLALKNPCMVKGNIVTEYFGNLSAGVYFIHPFIMYQFGVLPENNIVNLAAVFGFSILASIPIIFINKRIKIFL